MTPATREPCPMILANRSRCALAYGHGGRHDWIPIDTPYDPPDPLAPIDVVQKLAETLHGAVAVLTADGWTEDQARVIVLRAFLEPTRLP